MLLSLVFVSGMSFCKPPDKLSAPMLPLQQILLERKRNATRFSFLEAQTHPNIFTTLPVTRASTEHSFLTLWHLKGFLRNETAAERVIRLASLFIHMASRNVDNQTSASTHAE